MCSLMRLVVRVLGSIAVGPDMGMREIGEFSREGQVAPGEISVVVPVYRSEAILPELVRRLEPVLLALAVNFELILVNDCSPDRSWDVITRLVRDHPLGARHQPHAQLWPAQRVAVRHPRRPVRRHRHHG